MAGYVVHGDLTHDGNGVLTEVKLYEMGSPDTERTLVRTERLHVTDVAILHANPQAGYEVQLVADSVVAGRRLIHGFLETGWPLILRFRNPYICARATGLKFLGPQYGLTMCVIHGFIREA